MEADQHPRDSGCEILMLNGVEWSVSMDNEEQDSLPSEVLAMDALDTGATAWEDEATLKWEVNNDLHSRK